MNHEQHTRRFLAALKAYQENLADKDKIALDGSGTTAVTSWFTGPIGENGSLLEELVTESVRNHVNWRREVYPEDPAFITAQMQQLPDYQESVAYLRNELRAMFGHLRQSGAFFSMRSQGHMLGDQTLPSIIGYFAAMLYNQNNVAVEASPVTTIMELAVGDDLCKMLGYPVPEQSPDAAADEGTYPQLGASVTPWGHITCDGSVANAESMWMARNLKFFAPALKAAILDPKASLQALMNLEVKLLDGSKRKLVELDAWTLLNLPIDEVLDLPTIICNAPWNISTSTLSAAMNPFTVQNLGMGGACKRYLFEAGLTNLPVVTVPCTKHYSWPKSTALLGIGASQMLDVLVDLSARQDVGYKDTAPRPGTLRHYLQQCLDTKTPVLQVVAVIGSTEESAVDPLDDILALRDEFRDKGLEFVIHADAAWGGYFASMLRPATVPQAALRQGFARVGAAQVRRAKLVRELVPPIPELPMAPEIEAQYRVLPEADSITVDPHKAGYIPYPAGSLCYRHSSMRSLVTFSSPVIYRGSAEPTVGIYGIEGSKPGAAAASVYLSHKVIRPTQAGYGKLLGQCIFASKKLYCRFRTMAGAADPFVIAMLQRTPAEIEGKSQQEIDAQLVGIRTAYVGKSNQQIVQNPPPYDFEFFRRLGSDQVIVSYSFNFKNSDGTLNQDLDKLAQLNNEVFNALSMYPGKNPGDVPMIVTSSSFTVSAYGIDFMAAYLARLGIMVGKRQNLPAIPFLISTQMSPWFTVDEQNPQDGFLPRLEQILRDTVLAAIDKVRAAAKAG